VQVLTIHVTMSTPDGIDIDLIDILQSFLASANAILPSHQIVLATPTLKHTMRTLRTYAEAMKLPKAKEWDASLWREVEGLIAQGVFKVVPLPKGKKALSAKPVFKIKEHPDSTVKSLKTH
jgi:hypothetical protein